MTTTVTTEKKSATEKKFEMAQMDLEEEVQAREDVQAMMRGAGPDWVLLAGDCVQRMRTLPAESVDLILTDHAYESLEKHRAIGTTTRLKKSEGSNNKWFPPFPDARLPEFLDECWRVLKPDRHFYMVLDFTTTYLVQPMAVARGWRYANTIIWNKEAVGMGWRWREQVQPILMFEKGKRQMNNKGESNLIDAKRLRGDEIYPTQKPEDVAVRIILNSTLPSEIVLDPFCGSSSFGTSSVKCMRKYIGIDLVKDAIDFSREDLRLLG